MEYNLGRAIIKWCTVSTDEREKKTTQNYGYTLGTEYYNLVKSNLWSIINAAF